MPGQRANRPTIVYDLPLAPAGNGLVLRGQGWRTSVGLVSNTLFWMVVALSVLTVWMLLGTWRHMRAAQPDAERAGAGDQLPPRDGELDADRHARDGHAEGRITYVNPAFCAMTGFTEAELVGQRAALPVLAARPPRGEQAAAAAGAAGRSPRRRHRGQGDAQGRLGCSTRACTSRRWSTRSGQQTGWMTSMTNITEAKRIRDQLSASHERFTTVLEGLDAAVSVLSVQQSRTAVRQPLVPPVVRCRSEGPRAACRATMPACRWPARATRRSTTWAACRRRS